MSNPFCKTIFQSNPIEPPPPMNMTKFGALVNGSMSTASKIDILNALGLEYCRDGIIMNTYSGNHTRYDQYIAANKKVLLNFGWGQANIAPVDFPTDMVAYAAKLNEMLDDISLPEIVVIENEEFNPHYHTNAIIEWPKYITMVQTAAPIVHARGGKITDGGLGALGLDVCTYRYLKANYSQAIADDYGSKAMRPSQVVSTNNPGSDTDLEARAALIQGVLDGCKDFVDYFNIHAYEVANPNIADVSVITTITPDVFKRQKEFIEVTTGKKAISNETGTRNNTQPDLTTNMLINYDSLGIEYLIWFDGVGSLGSVPLNDQTYPYALRPNGIAFQNYILSLP